MGGYPLCSVTRIYNGHKFNRRRACWYVVFKANLLAANLSVEHVEENLSKVNLLAGKENLSTTSWINIPIGGIKMDQSDHVPG